MLYLNEKHLRKIALSWQDTVGVIRESTRLMGDGDFSQPIKPYLRYGNQTNRIIAMPSYVGGERPCAGIKWIASFPKNLKEQMPRAHSVTILNDAYTGKPLGVINTNFISGVRTAAVSGFVLSEFIRNKRVSIPYTIGIVGFGPIGKLHLDMVSEIMGDNRIQSILLYDIRPIDPESIPEAIRTKVTITNSWEEAYTSADIFITATVSYQAYIAQKPKKGSLHLNVSLRDYKPEFVHYTDKIVVDNWKEVCRENTDIENMHKEFGLQESDAYVITDLIADSTFFNLNPTDVVMFNPMGMAVYDVALGAYYYQTAMVNNIGQILED